MFLKISNLFGDCFVELTLNVHRSRGRNHAMRPKRIEGPKCRMVFQLAGTHGSVTTTLDYHWIRSTSEGSSNISPESAIPLSTHLPVASSEQANWSVASSEWVASNVDSTPHHGTSMWVFQTLKNGPWAQAQRCHRTRSTPNGMRHKCPNDCWPRQIDLG